MTTEAELKDDLNNLQRRRQKALKRARDRNASNKSLTEDIRELQLDNHWMRKRLELIADGSVHADDPPEVVEARVEELKDQLAANMVTINKLVDRRREVRNAMSRATAAAAKLRRRIVRLRERIRNLFGAPRIITAAQQGIYPDGIFGGLGPISYVTGHHTAGPTDDTDADAIRLNKQYDNYHRAQGWGGIGYHYNITRSGSIACLRPVAQKGAHVGGWNTGNVGITCHGTTGDTPTNAQKAAFRWLLANAHTSKMPSQHRTPVAIGSKPRRGHNDWSGHTWNACPGTHKAMYLSGGK